MLRTLPDACVDLCVTSPPYFALRSYLSADHPSKQYEMGSEETPAAFVSRLVDVLREVRRVLKPTGSMFVNIGDSYANDQKWGGSTGGKHVTALHGDTGIGRQKKRTGVPTKNLLLIPQRLAIALQEDGWIVRDQILWIKGREYSDDDIGLNPMPGSQKDRCTSAYEVILHCVKQQRYYFDWEAIAEPPRDSSIKRLGQDVEAQAGSLRANGGTKSNGTMKAVCFGGTKGGSHGAAARMKSGKAWELRGDTFARSSKYVNGQPDGKDSQHREEREPVDYAKVGKVMPRNVWIFPARGYKGSHYATFPPELPRRCILVGSSEHGCCSSCGKPWVRQSSKVLVPGSKAVKTAVKDERDEAGTETEDQGSKRQRDGHRNGYHYEIEQQGWRATCQCNAGVVPAVILDCFMGSGTTAAAAEELRRNWIGIDLDERNLPLIEQRLDQARRGIEQKKLKAANQTSSLFQGVSQ